MQASRVAHSIKDLEKALPSVASINGMQVKDYLQALSDDHKIRVEKIGSGNWYWSFLSEETKAKENLLAQVTGERDKAAAAVVELRTKVEQSRVAREEDDGGEEDMLMCEGTGKGERATFLARHAELVKSVEGLGKELAGYSENDPVEVEKRRKVAEQCKADAEMWTEGIQSMESWLKQQMGGEKSKLLAMVVPIYGDEFDEEEQSLKEL